MSGQTLCQYVFFHQSLECRMCMIGNYNLFPAELFKGTGKESRVCVQEAFDAVKWTTLGRIAHDDVIMDRSGGGCT
jgi:hypothetical protein